MTHRKTIALVALALLTLLPLAALAEPGWGRRGGGPGGPGGPGRHLFPPPGYLDLTEEQIEAAQAIRETVRDRMEGVREEVRALREQLRAALDSETPDATEVGQLAIALDAHRQAVRAVFEAAEADFAALLTAEQLEKWENFKELRGHRRGPRHRERARDGSGFGPGSDQL